LRFGKAIAIFVNYLKTSGPFFHLLYAGVDWMCKINGNMDKTLYKEILEDELERTIEYGTNKLRLERHQVIFQMTMILNIRPN